MTAVVGDISYPAYGNSNAISSTSSFSYNPLTHGQVAKITLTNAITVTMAAPTNIVEGAPFKLIFSAGDTSARTMVWSSSYKFPSAISPLIYPSTTSGAMDIISFIGGAGNTLIYDGYSTDVR